MSTSTYFCTEIRELSFFGCKKSAASVLCCHVKFNTKGETISDLSLDNIKMSTIQSIYSIIPYK